MSDDLVKRYREMQEAIGGCSDGYCVIKKPSGMHTNGGCKCLLDLKPHEASRVGHLLRHSQQMADRIGEAMYRLHKLKYWLDMDEEVFDAMTDQQKAAHKYVQTAVAGVIWALKGEKDE